MNTTVAPFKMKVNLKQFEDLQARIFEIDHQAYWWHCAMTQKPKRTILPFNPDYHIVYFGRDHSLTICDDEDFFENTEEEESLTYDEFVKKYGKFGDQTPKEKAVIKEQLEFIEWMKKHKLYNLNSSSKIMKAQHLIWKTMKESTPIQVEPSVKVEAPRPSSKELKLTQLIYNHLKIALEPDTRWVNEGNNYFVFFDSDHPRWVFGCNNTRHYLGQVYLSSETASVICDYLNEHCPDGI